MNPRTKSLTAALLAYCALALIAAFSLDGTLRNLVWLLLAILALKTLIVSQREDES